MDAPVARLLVVLLRRVVPSSSRFLDAGIDVRGIGMISGALTADYC